MNSQRKLFTKMLVLLVFLGFIEEIYKERVDASKLMKSNLKVMKGMMNKTELDYAAMGILFTYSGLKQYSIFLEV